MKTLLLIPLLFLSLQEPEPDRSPADLAVSPDGARVLTANATSDTVSLVDLAAGKVVAEVPVGRRPNSVAFAPDGARAVVTNWLSDTISVIDVTPAGLRVSATLPVGDEPRGVRVSPDGSKAYVAVSGEDAVAVVDLKAGKVAARVEVGDEPWHLALTPDGKRLAVGNALSEDLTVVDLQTLKAAFRVKLGGRNPRRMAVSPDGAWAYLTHVTERGGATTIPNIERGLVIANRLARIPLASEAARELVALDIRGFGAADLEGVAVSPDGQSLAVAVGGTGDLYFLRQPLPFTGGAGPDPIMDPKLYADKQKQRRINYRGRPTSVVFTPDGKKVLAANYMTNEVSVFEWESGNEVSKIPLGGPKQPSLARRGEKVFYNAFRSWHEWFSCATCHTEGHTNGGLYDTFNDGRYGNPLKKTLSLRGVTKTGPWTWHGRQTDLRESIRGSFLRTMNYPPDQLLKNKDEVEALMAFFETLDFAPSPHRNADGSMTEAARRGQGVFEKKGCAECHAPPHYTKPETYEVGLEEAGDAYKGFNPPPLRNLHNRGPYLHNGKAGTLEQVLTEFHSPSKVNGAPDLTPAELADLVAFLKSL